LDVETCFEQNYPRYGWNYAGNKFQTNADLEHGRVALTAATKLKEPCRNLYACPFLDYLLLDAKLFQQAKHRAKLIYLDCSNYQANHRDFRKNNPWTLSSLVLVPISATVDQLIPESGDQGLPPPAIHPLKLSARQELSLQSCRDDMDEETRPYLLTFTGVDRSGSPRQALVRLDQRQDPDLHLRLVPGIKGNQSAASLWSNQELLIKSSFAAAPRGDSPFSYRFAEILSAGAIPVIHSDGWVLPFHPKWLNWELECAVVVPEQRINETITILRAMSAAERCLRRKRCYEIYQKHLKNATGVIDGILQGLEHLASEQMKKNSQL